MSGVSLPGWDAPDMPRSAGVYGVEAGVSGGASTPGGDVESCGSGDTGAERSGGGVDSGIGAGEVPEAAGAAWLFDAAAGEEAGLLPKTRSYVSRNLGSRLAIDFGSIKFSYSSFKDLRMFVKVSRFRPIVEYFLSQ